MLAQWGLWGRMARGSSFSFALKSDDVPFATSGLEAPVLYAEVIRGSIVGRECVKLNLVDNRLDAIDQKIKSVHVATIVTPVGSLRSWANVLNRMVEERDALTEEAPPKA